jgi:hypothetical protein
MPTRKTTSWSSFCWGENWAGTVHVVGMSETVTGGKLTACTTRLPAQEFLAECKTLVEKATEGPWLYSEVRFGYDAKATPYVAPERGAKNICQVYSDAGMSDAEFIAHSRTAVPRMVAALEGALTVLDVNAFPLNHNPEVLAVEVEEVRLAIEQALGGGAVSDEELREHFCGLCEPSEDRCEWCDRSPEQCKCALSQEPCDGCGRNPDRCECPTADTPEAKVKLTDELINRLLFKYEWDKHFGVKQFRAALEAALGDAE